jgi:hypothetical protein
MSKYVAYGALVVALLSLVIVLTSGGTVTERIVEKMNLSGVTNLDSLTLSEDLIVTDDLTVSGKATVAGQIVNTPDTITATTTLTADSSTVQLLAASANMSTITLPAATAGHLFTFVVTGALTGSSVVIASAESDNIEGILMVNDTDVACAGEDFLNIVTDGEVVGDRVSLVADGTSWYILDSDIDAAGKMTCTDPS